MPMIPRLRLHAFLPTSRANGPGLRTVIWLQGCTLDCPGCFNPQTHPFQGGELTLVSELLARITALGNSIEGLTISGGEPFQQPRPLQALLQLLRAETSLSVLLFSGYTLDEIQRLPLGNEILAHADVLIAGRYIAEQRMASGLIGSANQTIHLLSERYTLDDLQAVPHAEIMITAEGDVIHSGIEPLR